MDEHSDMPVATATLNLTDTPPQEKPTEEPKKRAGPAQLILRDVAGGEPLKATKYPMPLKAPRFSVTINGEQCEAAQTTFGDIRYTYFLFNGASFYVPGHHDQATLWEFSFPESYNFKPLKLDRKEQSSAAAKAKAAKAAEAKAGAAAASPDAAANDGAVEGSSLPGSDALQEPASAEATEQSEPMGGKKSKRSQR
jgi:hypothetical protein